MKWNPAPRIQAVQSDKQTFELRFSSAKDRRLKKFFHSPDHQRGRFGAIDLLTDVLH
mgnify:CR=1 FL=1